MMNLRSFSSLLSLLVVAACLCGSEAYNAAFSTPNARELQTACTTFNTADSLVTAINTATVQTLAKNRIITVCPGFTEAFNGTELPLVNPVTVRCATAKDCSIVPVASYQGFLFNISAGSLTMDGFDISGFAGFDISGTTFGGIFFQGPGTKLTILNSKIHNNAANYGGAFHGFQSTLTLRNSVFDSNIAANNGGVVHASQSTVTVYNCTFSSNSVTYFGGALFAELSKVSINNTTLVSNNAGNGGGGLYTYVSTATIGTTSFLTNSAQFGGAFHLNSNSNATIQGTLFQGNTAVFNGGALYSYAEVAGTGGTITLKNGCRFLANKASLDAGAVYIYNGGFNFVNTTVFRRNDAVGVCDNIYYAAPQGVCGP